MKIEQFQTVSKFLSILSKIFAVSVLSILAVGSFNVLVRKKFAAFSLDQSRPLSILFSDATISQADYEWAFSIILPIILAFLGYIFFKTSYLFDYLADGQSPFTHSFVRSVKILGFLLIFADLATSFLYVFLMNFAAEEGVFLYFSLSSFFFTGLLLYLVSQILHYGINLKEGTQTKLSIKDE